MEFIYKYQNLLEAAYHYEHILSLDVEYTNLRLIYGTPYYLEINKDTPRIELPKLKIERCFEGPIDIRDPFTLNSYIDAKYNIRVTNYAQMGMAKADVYIKEIIDRVLLNFIRGIIDNQNIDTFDDIDEKLLIDYIFNYDNTFFKYLLDDRPKYNFYIASSGNYLESEVLKSYYKVLHKIREINDKVRKIDYKIKNRNLGQIITLEEEKETLILEKDILVETKHNMELNNAIKNEMNDSKNIRQMIGVIRIQLGDNEWKQNYLTQIKP